MSGGSLQEGSLSVEWGRERKRGIVNKEKYNGNQKAILKGGQEVGLLQLNCLCNAPGWSRKLTYGSPICHHGIPKKIQSPTNIP